MQVRPMLTKGLIIAMLLGSCGAVCADPPEHHPNTHSSSHSNGSFGGGFGGSHSIFDNDSHPAQHSQPRNNTPSYEPRNEAPSFQQPRVHSQHASSGVIKFNGSNSGVGNSNAFNGARNSGSYSNQNYSYGDQNVNGTTSTVTPQTDVNASFSKNRPTYQRSQWVEVTPAHTATQTQSHPRVTYGNSTPTAFGKSVSVLKNNKPAVKPHVATKAASSTTQSNTAEQAQIMQAAALGTGAALAAGYYTSAYYYGYYNQATAPTFSYYPAGSGVFRFNGTTVPLSPVGPNGGALPTGNAAYYGVPSQAVGQFGLAPNGTAAFYGVPSTAVGQFGAVPNGTAAFYGVPSQAVGQFGLAPNGTAAFYGVPSQAVGQFGLAPNGTAAFYGVPSAAVGQYGLAPNGTAAYYGVGTAALGAYGQPVGTPTFGLTNFQRQFYGNMYVI